MILFAGKDSSPGIIMYDVGGVKQTIPFSAKAVQGHFPKFGDKVCFLTSKTLGIYEIRKHYCGQGHQNGHCLK